MSILAWKRICPCQFQHFGSDKIFAMEFKSKSVCLTLQDIWSGNQRQHCFRKQRLPVMCQAHRPCFSGQRPLNHSSADRCAQGKRRVVYLHVFIYFLQPIHIKCNKASWKTCYWRNSVLWLNNIKKHLSSLWSATFLFSVPNTKISKNWGFHVRCPILISLFSSKHKGNTMKAGLASGQ